MRRRTFIAVLAARPRGRWRREDSSRCERSGFSAAGRQLIPRFGLRLFARL